MQVPSVLHQEMLIIDTTVFNKNALDHLMMKKWKREKTFISFFAHWLFLPLINKRSKHCSFRPSFIPVLALFTLSISSVSNDKLRFTCRIPDWRRKHYIREHHERVHPYSIWTLYTRTFIPWTNTATLQLDRDIYWTQTKKEMKSNMRSTREREREIYCSDGMHPTFVFEKVRYLIIETLNDLVDTFLPRWFEIFLLLDSMKEFSQRWLNHFAETQRNLEGTVSVA